MRQRRAHSDGRWGRKQQPRLSREEDARGDERLGRRRAGQPACVRAQQERGRGQRGSFRQLQQLRRRRGGKARHGVRTRQWRLCEGARRARGNNAPARRSPAARTRAAAPPSRRRHQRAAAAAAPRAACAAASRRAPQGAHAARTPTRSYTRTHSIRARGKSGCHVSNSKAPSDGLTQTRRARAALPVILSEDWAIGLVVVSIVDVSNKMPCFTGQTGSTTHFPPLASNARLHVRRSSLPSTPARARARPGCASASRAA